MTSNRRTAALDPDPSARRAWLGAYAVRRSRGSIVASTETFGDVVLDAAEGLITAALRFLRDDQAFRCTQLVDVVVLPTCGAGRVCVVYNLLSVEHAQRVRLRAWRRPDQEIPTAASLFANARLLEAAIDAELDGTDAFLRGKVDVHVDRVSGMLVFEPVSREFGRC